MTDIFISYASEDRDYAERLANTFAASGWSVWWDRKIVIGQVFDHAIERALDTAKCVVVLWSHHSIASEWVRNEAAVAAERGVIVPAVIDDAKIPLEFRRKQTADLSDWTGSVPHGGFESLCEGIRITIGSGPAPGPLRIRSPKLRLIRPSAMMVVVAVGIAILAIGWLVHFAELGAKTSVAPQLVFVWNESTGWFLRNDGNGTAFHVVVAHRPHLVSEWNAPTVLYPIPKGERVSICWVGQNPDKLVAVYADMSDRIYTSFTDEDVTKISDGDSARTWKESEVRRVWERPCS